MDSIAEAAKLILEMSYQRKRALELLPSHANQLARKMVMLHHMPADCSHAPHWETTTNSHINDIFALTNLKGNKKLSKDDINEVVFDEPFGEYRNYLMHHSFVSTKKHAIEFSPPSEADYNQIKSKYEKLIPLLSSNDIVSPKYSDLG